MTLQDCRIFHCERCLRLVLICRRCDCGNRYCPSCAPLARAEKQREAGERYQKTENGRLNHKVRQEKYRDRLQKNVTHHGDLGISGKPKSATAMKRCGNEIRHERRQELPQPSSRPGRCDFCGRPCSCPGRTGPLPRRRHAYRRGPRLPHHEPARQRGYAATIIRACRKAGNGSEMKEREEILAVHSGRAAQTIATWHDLEPEIASAALLLQGLPAGPETGLGAATAIEGDPVRTAASAPGTHAPAIAAVHAPANLTRQIVDILTGSPTDRFDVAIGCRKRKGADHAPFGNSFLEVNMLNKRPQPPQPDRIRSIQGSFSWIDHRFLRQGFDQGLTRLEKLL